MELSKYFTLVVVYAIFTLIAGNYFIGNTVGYIDEYQSNCDEIFIVPNIPYIEMDYFDKSYYFDNEKGTCEKLNFLIYFMTGLTMFIIGMGMVTVFTFFIRNEIHVIVRERY